MKDLFKFPVKASWASFCLAFVILAGCAGAPDIASTEKSTDQPYSAADIRHMTVDQPFVLSGDYFRQRGTEPSATVEEASAENKPVKKVPAAPEGQPYRRQKPAEPQATSASTVTDAASTAAPVRPPMKNKVALLVDRRQLPADDARMLERSACTQASNFPVVLVSPKEIQEYLFQQKEIDPSDLDGVSTVLAVYPGVRMLVLVRTFHLPEEYPGRALATAHLMDAGISHRYPPVEVTMALTTAKDAQHLADALVHTAFDKAVYHSTLTPWFCRSFSHENQMWYINAGKDSGLNAGDRLKVVSGGTLIKAPSGVPAGWLPGDGKGTLQVNRLFGRDLAECYLVEGSGPDERDLLVK